MILFFKKSYLKKFICLFAFAFIFDSFAFGLNFKDEIQSKNQVITNESAKTFTDIFDRESEKEKEIFYFAIKFISLSLQFIPITQSKENSHFFIKEIPYNQFSIPPPVFS